MTTNEPGSVNQLEGFAARPQDIMPAVRDMALKIGALQAECERLAQGRRAVSVAARAVGPRHRNLRRR